MDFRELFQASIVLFAVVNPIGSIPIFLELMNGMNSADREKTVRTAAYTSVMILFIFMIAGKWILSHLFQINISDLMAAGGLLLLIIAIDHLVFGALVRSVRSPGPKNVGHLGAVPMACPILAGPGAMMTVFINFSEFGFLISISSVIVVFALTWVILRFIDNIYKFLGETVCLVLSKILCLFLAAIGIRFFMQGIAQYFSR